MNLYESFLEGTAYPREEVVNFLERFGSCCRYKEIAEFLTVQFSMFRSVVHITSKKNE